MSGKPRAEAEADIIAADLLVGTVDTAYSDAVTEDLVISQEPVGGTLLPKNSEVNLVVSLGPAPGVVCTEITDKGSCNNEAACEWQGSPKNGSCGDVVACNTTPGAVTQELSGSEGSDNDCDGLADCDEPDCGVPTDCSVYNGNQSACQNEAACRWSKRNNLCLNR